VRKAAETAVGYACSDAQARTIFITTVEVMYNQDSVRKVTKLGRRNNSRCKEAAIKKIIIVIRCCYSSIYQQQESKVKLPTIVTTGIRSVIQWVHHYNWSRDSSVR
jgi:hypothetical protein